MSRNHSQVETADGDRRPSQFDLLLAAIPLALLAGLSSVFLFSVPQFVGVALGAAIAAGLIGYSVYAVARIMSRSNSREPRLHERSHQAD
ncbi:hypothetical protein halTADL_0606 [Halohasta litchfieldiae]|jgi:hypothetical protein|uniref:Uncharacterized protein n=1 Tax=Halohasta litchfieldiae TaxID=1073996 RepID=A0A1H6UCY2_9EURY|nr:hypothetical protein [Halohasta litchfieldiae]ATW87409.1 hypothetical protein halTADL_0606 [Halohasta litchfieldiae]SEI90263.1 hypothetical protein SAMN05444271_11140 [Halohasta litchfieldiae]